MKLLLINPPRMIYANDPLRCGTPLGLLSLAGQVKRELPDVQVSLIDAVVEGSGREMIKPGIFRHGLVGDALKARIREARPDVVGIGNIFTAEWLNAAYCARAAKEVSGDATIVLGGHHPSFEPEFMLKNAPADFVVLGEGERPFVELLKTLGAGGRNGAQSGIRGLAYLSEGSLVQTGMGPKAASIDDLADPQFDLLIPGNYGPSTNHSGGVIGGPAALIDLSVSRGCPNACNYCTTSSMWGRRIRAFSPDRIRAQVQRISELGFDHACIEDDHVLLLPRESRDALFCALKRHSIPWCIDAGTYYPLLNKEFVEEAARAGCYKIAVSFEHPLLETMRGENKYHDVASQDDVRKKIREACTLLKNSGIAFYAAMMVGFQNETMETLKLVREYARMIVGLGAQFATFFYWKPLPGTADYARHAHLIREEDSWKASPEKWLLVKPIIEPEGMTIPEMTGFVEEMSLEVNGHPNTLISPDWK